METLTYEEMCQRYPNEWLLLDEPVYNQMDVVSGTVLAHHPDKQKLLAYLLEEIIKIPTGHTSSTIYTGVLPPPPYRPWLHATIIRELEKTI